MTRASGVGSHPGDDQRAYDEAVRLVLGELPELAYLPEVPGRGPTASMTGRAVAVLAELGADLQPAGWRLTDAAGCRSAPRSASTAIARPVIDAVGPRPGTSGR